MVLTICSLSDASRAGDKFETLSTNTGYSKFMKLKIRNVGPGDFGSYRCVAKNSLGETDGLIKLDGELRGCECASVFVMVPPVSDWKIMIPSGCYWWLFCSKCRQ